MIGSVLSQSGLAVAGQGRKTHHLALGPLLPRIKRHLTPGVLQTGLVLAALLVAVCKPAQRPHRHSLEPLALQQQPLLKPRAVTERKPLQEAPLVQSHGLAEPRQTRLTRSEPATVVSLTGLQQLCERRHVQPMIAVPIELHGPMVDEQKRLC